MKAVAGIFLDNLSIGTLDFTPTENKLIIGTHQHAMLLDGQTGKTIMETEMLQRVPPTNRTWVRAVLMQHVPILVTSTHNHDDECDVALWDVISGKCIAKLLEKEKQLTGIGATASCRSVISIKPSGDMIETEFYNDTVAGSLNWSLYKMDLSQKHLFLRLCCASKLKDSVELHPDCLESDTLQGLPADFKVLVEKYLLKK